NSTIRTAEQTEIGKFWNPPIQNFWNQIAQTVALTHHSDLTTTARLFATLNLSFADPTWLPLSVNTAADPSYPGAHSTISAVGADVLASFYGDHQSFSVTSTALPGVTRSFTSFTAAAQEAGLSRIFSGQHTRLDHVAGVKLGREVAGFVLHNALLPAHDSSGK